MKTPEEIKRGLSFAIEYCLTCDCCITDCPYDLECHPMNDDTNVNVPKQMMIDALSYIRDLETTHRTEYCEQADYDCIELGMARKRIAELEADLKHYKDLFSRTYDLMIDAHKALEGAENCTNCLYADITGTNYCYDCRWFDGENNRLKWVRKPEPPKEEKTC